MSLNRSPSMAGLSERRAMNMRMSGVALATVMPCWVTSVGRSGSARFTLFCTCTWATSALVPVEKVSVMTVWPLEPEVELKYSRLSMPVSCCSMTCVTVASMVAALPPG